MTPRTANLQIPNHLIRPVKTQPKKHPSNLAGLATDHRNAGKYIPGRVLNVRESRNWRKSVARKKSS